MPAHICASLISLVQRHSTRVTTSCDGRHLTAQELHDRVASLSTALSKTLKVQQGDRIALAGLNTDFSFEALLAIIDAGAVASPLNTRWSSTEVAAALQLTKPSYIIVDSSAEPLIRAACAKLQGATPHIILLGPSSVHHHSPTYSADLDRRQIASPCTEQLITNIANGIGAQSADASAAVHPHNYFTPSTSTASTKPTLQLLQSGENGVALICFTSGTTGRSKGAMLSHSALLHQSMSKLAVVGYCSSDVYLHVPPLFHIGGISSALAVLAAAGAHVFMPRYSPSSALHLIQTNGVTAMIAVPAMMQDITAAAATGSSRDVCWMAGSGYCSVYR